MPGERRRVAAFCPLCVSRCGCEAVVEDGSPRRLRTRGLMSTIPAGIGDT